MPLIKPEVQNLLREAGLAPGRSSSSSAGDNTLNEKMDQVGLTDEMLLEGLYDIAKLSGNEAIRLRALETALKARGSLKESAQSPPSFTIVIQPSSFQQSPQNSQNVPEGVNPILLPRQLLNKIKTDDTVQ